MTNLPTIDLVSLSRVTGGGKKVVQNCNAPLSCPSVSVSSDPKVSVGKKAKVTVDDHSTTNNSGTASGNSAEFPIFKPGAPF